jgi:NADPH:quinone reductase-like Zn-dependent oxidoreductase
MKAAFINEHGNLEKIQIGELDIPRIKSNEVLIKTKYAALNHLDLFVVRGLPGLKLPLPHVIGADGSGTVKEVGSEVSTISEGDKITINPGLSCGHCKYCLSGQQVFCKEFKILGENKWGTYAEYFKVPEINVLKVPSSYPLDKAAAAPLTFLTAWRMLITQAKIKPDEIIFIHGAGGGVSSAAIQIAKYIGAKVITTTSTKDKMEMARKLGADHVINYKEMKDYVPYVYTELTNKRGIDIVIDNIGQATFEQSIQMLKAGGRLITCGVTSGPFTKINITNIFWKHLEIKGSTMANQIEFYDVMNLVLEEKLNPIIDKVFPLEQIREAEQHLSEGKQFGKILLKIS